MPRSVVLRSPVAARETEGEQAGRPGTARHGARDPILSWTAVASGHLVFTDTFLGMIAAFKYDDLDSIVFEFLKFGISAVHDSQAFGFTELIEHDLNVLNIDNAN